MKNTDSAAFFRTQFAPQDPEPDSHKSLGMALVTVARPQPNLSANAIAHEAHVMCGRWIDSRYFVPSLSWLDQHGEDWVLQQGPQSPSLILKALQHAPATLNARDWFQLAHGTGIFSSGIAYEEITMIDNKPIAGGFGCDQDLTDHGKKLIDLMLSVGITLDLSHTNAATAASALRHVQRVAPDQLHKVIVSHTGILWPDGTGSRWKRNLPLELLQEIGKEGYVGLYLLNAGLFHQSGHEAPEVQWYAVLQEVTRAISAMSGSHLGIGSDIHHCVVTDQAQQDYYAKMREFLKNNPNFDAVKPAVVAPPLRKGNPLKVLRQELAEEWSVSEDALNALFWDNFTRLLIVRQEAP
jgi:microsomal dipeptidase-like Zn-dependent dipeptidase